MTHPGNNETLNLYSEGATLSKGIHEGRPKPTKQTFVALLSLTSHSTFYECSRSILCQPPHPPHSPSTRLGVIIFFIPYTWKERSHHHQHPLFRPTFTPSQVTKQYGAYTASPAKKTTSTIIDIKIDKCLQF